MRQCGLQNQRESDKTENLQILVFHFKGPSPSPCELGMEGSAVGRCGKPAWKRGRGFTCPLPKPGWWWPAGAVALGCPVFSVGLQRRVQPPWAVCEAGKREAPSSLDAGFVCGLEPLCDGGQIASAPCISLPFSVNRLWLVPSVLVHLYYRAQG